MKITLAYSSKTGNTEKVAKYIANLDSNINIEKMEKDYKFNDDSDLYIIGGWIDKGTFDPFTLEAIKSLKGKKVAFFYTLGAYPTSKHAFDCTLNIKTLLEKENEVINFFHCQGPVSKKLMDWMLTLPEDHGHYPDEARLKRWEIAALHPNEEDFEAAKNFYVGTMRYFNA